MVISLLSSELFFALQVPDVQPRGGFESQGRMGGQGHSLTQQTAGQTTE